MRWHAIGRLQRNKVRSLAPVVHLWQTVDRLDLGLEIAKRAPGAAVLVQVNVSDEPQKGGCPPDETAELVAALVDAGLDGPRADDGRAAPARPTRPEPGFATLRALADDLDLPVRSMGMSGDLEVGGRRGRPRWSVSVRPSSALVPPCLVARPPR